MVQMTRRQFLKTSAVAAGVTVLPSGLLYGKSANEKLNIACIGVGGRGGAHVMASLSENLVALCDIDENHMRGALGAIAEECKKRGIPEPTPRQFYDYREMFDKMEKEIDAVVVSTPDHHHAPASMIAIKLGKHVYCEKPLTHNIREARRLAEAAKKAKVATQMGNQGRAGAGWRRLCEWIWAGAIGNVREVHVWTDRPGIPTRFWWPQGGTRPAGADPVPPHLHWDLFLGPAPERPYCSTYKEGKFKGHSVYHPFVWRGWWDFGTGALGDIGCHAMSGIFTALKIKHAAAVELVRDSGDGNDEMFPQSCVIRWDIPEREGMPPCQIYWYDGAAYPPRDVAELAENEPYPDNGLIVVGDKGKLWDGPAWISGEKMEGWQDPPQVIPRCESDHFTEWVTACKGGRAPFSNFVDHAGPLTEMVLLGNLAIKAGVGNRVEWNGRRMRVTNLRELNEYVGREYRKGWSV